MCRSMSMLCICFAAVAIAGEAPVDETKPESPNWPIAMALPEGIPFGKSKQTPPRADVLAWVPPEAQRIRCVFVIPNNTDSMSVGTHKPLRAVAAKHGMAIVYLRTCVHWGMGVGKDLDAVPRVLDALAERTGVAGLRHAPWITFGKSSVGTFPYWMAWAHPTRTIACISYHGQVPEWPPASWADLKDQTILYASINGDTEWMGTWYRHVRPMLLNYRARSSWLPHQVVLKGIDHGNYPDGSGSQGWGKPVPAGAISCLRVWDYIALFIDKAIALRVPADADPAAGPVILKAVDPDAGWLVHPRATEVLHGAKWRPIRQTDGLFTIVDHVKEPTEVYAEEQGTLDQARLLLPASEVPAAEHRGWLWLPDRELAEAWRRLHTVHVQPPAEDKPGP